MEFYANYYSKCITPRVNNEGEDIKLPYVPKKLMMTSSPAFIIKLL